MSGAGEGRERLELEDFETPDGVEFDPVRWLNSRLAKSGVTFDKLDQHLLSLGMSCQLLCQDTSESIEVASNQLVTQLPTTGRDLERMHQETLRGRGRLTTVLEDLREADDRKRSGLQGLAEIDAVKTRVETAYSALREVGSWDRKVRDCDQMVHSNNLPAALAQLTSLKGVLDAFRMLPEYSKKEEQLGQLEESLLGAAQRRTRFAFERNSATDLRACSEVLVGMGRHGELASIATAGFLELSEKAWQSAPVASGAAAAATAAGAVLAAVAKASEERWPLFQALDAATPPAASDGAASPGAGQASPKDAPPRAQALAAAAVLVAAVQAGLGFLSGKVEATLAGGAGAEAGEEASAHARAARAVGLLAAYVDGLARLAACGPMAADASLWTDVCRGGAKGEVLPWALLRDVAHHVVWRGMQDDAQALVPPVNSQLRPSEAVLAAESNAKRLLQMPGTWARRLEQHGAGQLAVLWLASVDETCAWYWKQWDQLIQTFENTLHLKRPNEGEARSVESSYDFGLLNECMQLHSMLHGSLQAQFSTFQAEVLQLAARLRAPSAAELPPFGRAVLEKLTEQGQWCERFAVPSAGALRAALAALEGAEPDSPALRMRTDRALPAAAAALTAAEKQVRALVAQCCVQPAAAVLGVYSEAPEWAAADDPADAAASAMPGGLLPLPAITAVGEHLFSLVPQLEQPQEGVQVRWLPLILDSVVDVAVQKALQIKQLTCKGAQQLVVDLEYLQKLTDALGSSEGASGAEAAPKQGGPAARLCELLDALGHLAAQRRRRQECLARGEDFREAPREGAPLERKAERALRAALGLPG